MTYLILFDDAAGAPADLRQRHMAAHLQFLEDHADEIRAAGPLFDAAGQGAGGAWIVTAADRQVAEDLVRSDPFWPTGLRAGVRILEWRQVFADGRRKIGPDEGVLGDH